MNYSPLCLALIVGTQSLVAQTLPRASAKSSTSAQGSSHAPFDTHAAKVQSGFRGNDVDAVYEAVRKNLPDLSKSQFETSHEYAARLKEISSKPFWGNMKAEDEFSFVLSPPSGRVARDDEEFRSDYIHSAYDADTHEMTVIIPLLATSDPEGGYYRWASLWHRILTPLGSYVGENAFGVRKTVGRLGVTDTDLVIEDSEWLDFDCNHESDAESCSFQVDSQRARELAGDVRVVLVGALIPPFTSEETDVTKPSVSDPHELDYSRKLVHMRLDELLIVDNQSGSIVQKLSREIHAAEYPVNVEISVKNDATPSDPRCAESDFSTWVDPYYSVDGGEEANQFLDLLPGKSTIKVSARKFVDVRIKYCDIPRLIVSLNGQPYTLKCERQERYIGNTSKCGRIQLGSPPSSVVDNVEPTAPMVPLVERTAPMAPVVVPEKVLSALALSQPVPVYPPIAKAAHVQGVVSLHATVSKQGTIENLYVVSGPPMLTGSAFDAVRRWRYTPYLVNGQAAEVETTITLTFGLGK